jgi:hypothetical protein
MNGHDVLCTRLNRYDEYVNLQRAQAMASNRIDEELVRRVLQALKTHDERLRAQQKQLLTRASAVHVHVVRRTTDPNEGNYIYLCTCVHACTHTHTHLHTRTLTHTHTYIHAYIHTHTHACIHTYIYTHQHTYIPTNIHTYVHSCIHTHIHTHTYIHIHGQADSAYDTRTVYRYTNAHTDICIHTHVTPPPWKCCRCS